MKHGYAESSSFVNPVKINYTMDQFSGICVSVNLLVSKMYMPGYCHKNIILLTNIMSDARAKLLYRSSIVYGAIYICTQTFSPDIRNVLTFRSFMIVLKNNQQISRHHK